MKRLYIEHNYGSTVLENVTLEEYQDGCFEALGVVVGGLSTDRLLGATLSKSETPRQIRRVDIWDRHIYCFDKVNDYWRVSIVFC